MSMDTDALRWFQQVADGVTVTEVADIYRVSQPGVSRALARLEEEVGTPLLHKTGRVLRPTHAGTVFKRHVDSALHGLDDGLAAVSELVDPTTGTVVVAFQLSLGTWLVPGAIAQFRREYPRVRFELEQSHDVLGSSLLTGGRIDLEFTAQRPRDPAVQWKRLFSQPLLLAVPPGHRLAGRTEISLAEVADDEFVMLRPGWERKLKPQQHRVSELQWSWSSRSWFPLPALGPCWTCPRKPVSDRNGTQATHEQPQQGALHKSAKSGVEATPVAPTQQRLRGTGLGWWTSYQLDPKQRNGTGTPASTQSAWAAASAPAESIPLAIP